MCMKFSRVIRCILAVVLACGVCTLPTVAGALDVSSPGSTAKFMDVSDTVVTYTISYWDADGVSQTFTAEEGETLIVGEEGNSYYQNISITENLDIETPAAIIPEGYGSVGFDYEYDAATATHTLSIAFGSLIEYNISYDLAGGSNSSANPSTYTVEDSITLAEPTRTAYVFAGWVDDSGFEVSSIHEGSTGDLSLCATWIPNLYYATISGVDYQYEYTGSPITFEILVTHDGNILYEGVDYVVSWLNNVSLGYAGLVIESVSGVTAGYSYATFLISMPQEKVSDKEDEEEETRTAVSLTVLTDTTASGDLTLANDDWMLGSGKTSSSSSSSSSDSSSDTAGSYTTGTAQTDVFGTTNATGTSGAAASAVASAVQSVAKVAKQVANVLGFWGLVLAVVVLVAIGAIPWVVRRIVDKRKLERL